MIVKCIACKRCYDDEFRWTICPHETFAANDGSNNFSHHPESLLTEPFERPTKEIEGLAIPESRE